MLQKFGRVSNLENSGRVSHCGVRRSSSFTSLYRGRLNDEKFATIFKHEEVGEKYQLCLSLRVELGVWDKKLINLTSMISHSMGCRLQLEFGTGDSSRSGI
mgnify:CR=1 FL=1